MITVRAEAYNFHYREYPLLSDVFESKSEDDNILGVYEDADGGNTGAWEHVDFYISVISEQL